MGCEGGGGRYLTKQKLSLKRHAGPCSSRHVGVRWEEPWLGLQHQYCLVLCVSLQEVPGPCRLQGFVYDHQVGLGTTKVLSI